MLDFGTACRLTKPKMKCPELVGTVSYMSPEIIKGYFTDKCDIWSCGVIFYILLTSKSPFKCKRREDTFQKILNSEITFEGTFLFFIQVLFGKKSANKPKIFSKSYSKKIHIDVFQLRVL